MVNKIITGANYGFISWLMQRLTAVVMLVSLLILLICILCIAYFVGQEIYTWQQIFENIFIKIILQIFFLAVIIHAWVGVRDIWMDYISCTLLKLGLHTLTFLWLIASLLYSVKVIW